MVLYDYGMAKDPIACWKAIKYKYIYILTIAVLKATTTTTLIYNQYSKYKESKDKNVCPSFANSPFSMYASRKLLFAATAWNQLYEKYLV